MKSKTAEDWIDNEHLDYFDPAESENWLECFWGKDSIFKNRFASLETKKSHILEIACGWGRHAEIVSPESASYYALDVSPRNIKVTTERLKNIPQAKVVLNDGFSFSGLDNGSIDTVFSFDAMVHFEDFVVFSYLSEISRVLKVHGRALLHHSNLSKETANAEDYHKNPSWRSGISLAEFDENLKKVGLKLISRDFLEWGGVKELDALSLLEKIE